MESAIPCLFRTCVRARSTASEAHVLLLCCSLDREERNTRTAHSPKKSGKGGEGVGKGNSQKQRCDVLFCFV